MATCVFFVLENGLYGTYYAINAGACSWHAFTEEIFGILHQKMRVRAIKSAEAGRMAERPAYSVLENYKLEQRKIYGMRPWQEAFRDFLQKNGHLV